MAFELGGRADKFGNRYERRYFVSLMAKVLQGGLLSVQSEPTGDDESGYYRRIPRRKEGFSPV